MAAQVVIYWSCRKSGGEYARVVELADSLDSGSSVHYARAGSSPASRTIVGASFVSLAPTFLQKSERAHAAAPPLQIEPASLGFDLVFFDGNRKFCIAIRAMMRVLTAFKSCKNTRLFYFLSGNFGNWLPAGAVQFEAVLKFMWDYNTTDFMHFETTAFATFHLIGRLQEMMEQAEKRLSW